jgi:TolB-like protein/DNA-binding winged helix-turn-helix (wHTH) protein/Tfp pilus assembly protein PilF
MTSQDEEHAVRLPNMQARFGRYVLDFDRGSLLLEGSEIALRPKTFAVLRHLVENSGRLVPKEELFAAVWPNLAVTDDTLVQTVGELRRALADDGPLLIRTFPRRGYRFDAAVLRVAPAARNEGTQSAATGIRAHVPTWRTMITGSRRRLCIALALVVLLSAGAVWTGVRHEWRFLYSITGLDRSEEGRASVGSRPAIAILPILNQTDDSTREHLADGLTQDIITALGRFSALTVMSWNAVLPFKGRPTNPQEIARTLAVRYQVEGNVRYTTERVRVSLQLVNSDGRVLWSSNFDEALTDLFSLQDKIAAQIAGALAIRISQVEQQRVFAKPTESLEAYEYVLRARPALNRPERGNIAEARVLLRRAIQLDPNYAAAYSALAETYYIALSMGWAESPAAFLTRAGELANKSLRLSDSDVRARIILGRIHLFDQRYDQAKAELDRAIAVNPSNAHGIAAHGNIMMWLGKADAAIEALELAERIDPILNPFDRNALSMAYYLKGRYEAAIRQAELNIQQTGITHFSHAILAAASAQLNRFEDAKRAVSTIRRTDPTFDAKGFGSKFLNSEDLEHLREGLRRAGLYPKVTPAAN